MIKLFKKKKPTPPARINEVSLTLFGGNCYFHAPSHVPVHIDWNGKLDHEGTPECVIWTKNPFGQVQRRVVRGEAATILKEVATAFAHPERASSMGAAQKRADKLKAHDKKLAAEGHTEFLVKTTVPTLDQITNSSWNI